MATLTTQTVVRTGTTFTTASAAGGGDQFRNTGREVLYVSNGGGSPINVTLAPAGLPGGLALATHVVAVANGAAKFIGPFDPTFYNNASGMMPITYSGVTSVVVAVVKVP